MLKICFLLNFVSRVLVHISIYIYIYYFSLISQKTFQTAPQPEKEYVYFTNSFLFTYKHKSLISF